MHGAGLRQPVVPVERLQHLRRLVLVDQLAVVHPELLGHPERGEEVGPDVVEGPDPGLGVGQLLAERHQVVGGGDVGGADAAGGEDVLPVVDRPGEGGAGGEGGDAVELVVPDPALPRAGGQRRQVRVGLDLVPGQVRRQVRELGAGQLAGLEVGVPPRRQLHPVGELAGGGERRDRGVVGVAVGGLDGDRGAQRLADGLVELVARGRDGAPQRGDRRVRAALARDAADGGRRGGRVGQEPGVGDRAVREGDRGDVRLDRGVRNIGRQGRGQPDLGVAAGLDLPAAAARTQQWHHRGRPGHPDRGAQDGSAVHLEAHGRCGPSSGASGSGAPPEGRVGGGRVEARSRSASMLR